MYEQTTCKGEPIQMTQNNANQICDDIINDARQRGKKVYQRAMAIFTIAFITLLLLVAGIVCICVFIIDLNMKVSLLSIMLIVALALSIILGLVFKDFNEQLTIIQTTTEYKVNNVQKQVDEDYNG